MKFAKRLTVFIETDMVRMVGPISLMYYYENYNQKVYDLIVHEMDHGPISSTFDFKLEGNMQEPCRYVWSEIINGMFCLTYDKYQGFVKIVITHYRIKKNMECL